MDKTLPGESVWWRAWSDGAYFHGIAFLNYASTRTFKKLEGGVAIVDHLIFRLAYGQNSAESTVA
jgi:hypothetical protein